VVSPPDAVAASGIIKGLGLNKRVITILEGESLVNDASALIAYRYAVAAVTTGSFVFWQAGLQFLLVAGVGILIGILSGYLFVLSLKRIHNNAIVETSLTLLAPFVAYLAAEHFHMSGVLAVVSTGLVISWRGPEVFSYRARIRTRVVWDTVIYLLQGFVFILIGLQLPSIIIDLGRYPFAEILGYGLLISLVTILIRIIWVFGGAYWFKIFKPIKDAAGEIKNITEPDDTWKNVMVVAWTGTRGVISLAAALALPLVMQDGGAFPKRHSIIFLAFVVIFVTLVVQGLSLPLLVRWLKIKPQDNENVEANELQLHLASSTLHFIETELKLPRTVKFQQQLKNKYEGEIQQLTKVIKRHKKAIRINEAVNDAPPDELYIAQLAINKFQRELLLKVHKEGEFSDAVIRQVERKMDIDELKLNLQVPPEE
jgi:CPA1 family monovalent cation:H+ antiporter